MTAMDQAMRPEENHTGNVIQQFEGHETYIDCDRLSCRLAQVCTLKTILREAQDDMFASLNKYTLADLLHKKPKMIRLLQQSA